MDLSNMVRSVSTRIYPRSISPSTLVLEVFFRPRGSTVQGTPVNNQFMFHRVTGPHQKRHGSLCQTGHRQQVR